MKKLIMLVVFILVSTNGFCMTDSQKEEMRDKIFQKMQSLKTDQEKKAELFELIDIAYQAGYNRGYRDSSQPTNVRPNGTIFTDMLDSINPRLTNTVAAGAVGFQNASNAQAQKQTYTYRDAQGGVLGTVSQN